MVTVYIGLGSNLGDRRAAFKQGISAIKALEGINYFKLSKIYETSPVGPKNQGKFLNAVAKLQTSIKPFALIRKFADIEAALGRPAKEKRIHWGPRVFDIDILFYGDRIINSSSLTIPHPQVINRQFVLQPLSDLAPDFRHPINHKTVAQMLDELN